VTLAAVVLSALVFKTYGQGIFLASPFVIGAVTAFMANRRSELSLGQSTGIVGITGFAACMMLLGLALEGILCVVVVAPLAVGAAMLGGLLGRELALRIKNPGRKIASSIAVLPLIFALEAAFPPVARFETQQSIEVRAEAAHVWKAIVQMETIEEPLLLAHRLGLAYPVRGRVFGAGVGALRYGDFSTGTAIERVTEWVENKKLTFVVLKDVAGLRELSPYRHVHAPHVIGYFTTRETSFELVEKSGGLTEIVERTSHELRLDPALYWLPIVRHVVDHNNGRVLAHIKKQAERGATAGLSDRASESADMESRTGFLLARE
jgi:hypothetical protein